MKFGENLYNLRKAAKMSQEKLAEKMEVTRQSVSKWENGESYPEMEKIMKLCTVFHCKINDLVHENMVDIDSFTIENVRYIKEMAKLMIIALILPTCGGIIFEKILSTDLGVDFELFNVIQILFLFGISYIFEYGYELQQDTKAKMYGEVLNNE